MKNCKIILAALALLCLSSCAQKASIDCTIDQAPSCQITVKRLNINSYEVLDTLKTDASGRLRYSVKVKEGQPEFIYLFKGETSLSALLLEAGEKAVVSADTLGNYTVSGSEGSLKLQEVDSRYSRFIYKMAELVEASDSEDIPDAARKALQEEMTKLYVSHYRECVKYVMENPKSLTVIPVLFENLSEYTPVFSRPTDAVIFSNAYDSLAAVYPESRYVKALGREAKARTSQLNLNTKLSNAESVNFLDINLPDINGEKKSLSALDKKVILVHFWTSTDDEQKMFNIDVLKPVYDEFKDRGFEIYSVCVDPDKSAWAAVVKAQKLDWINVNDGLGASSNVLAYYNVTELPTSLLIIGGEISTEKISGVDALRKVLRRELK